MQHDIDYVRHAGDYLQAYRDDALAISKSGYGLDGLALKFGLTARMIGNTLTGGNLFNYNTNYGELDTEQTRQFGDYLYEQYYDTKD